MMDLDDARSAWREDAADWAPVPRDILLEARRARIPGALIPLIRGQRIALALGIGTALVGGAYLADVWPHPWASAIALSLILQGAGTVAFSVRVAAGVASLDVTAPARTLHQTVTALRTWFVVGGLSVGLSWLFTWPLMLVALLQLTTGTDLVATSPAFLALVTGSGAVTHVVALALVRRRFAEPQGRAQIERWFSDRSIEQSLRLLEPFE
jgi:hypothetical protein